MSVETQSISAPLNSCFRKYDSFIKSVQRSPRAIEGSKNLTKTPIELHSIGEWQDEMGRLRMWAANIGAHRVGQPSLDFRLRDSSHIREQIIGLLNDVLRRLEDAQEFLLMKVYEPCEHFAQCGSTCASCGQNITECAFFSDS